MKKSKNIAVVWAILAAALYAVSSPVSKLLLPNVPPVMMAAFLYLGAGAGMFVLGLFQKPGEKRLSKKELPFTIGMIVLDIAAPILLMLGLATTTAANVCLLNNFEIVATSFIALIVFKEAISKRLWLAIVLITLSSMILSFEDSGSLQFSVGSLFVLLACVCWGFENNCTRKMSQCDPLQIVVIKGFASGLGSLAIAFVSGEQLPALRYIPWVLSLGFIAYGLSIFFYVYAQRKLGAAKTSAFYAIAPFIGTALSFVIFRDLPGIPFFIALAIMICGTYFASTEKKVK